MPQSYLDLTREISAGIQQLRAEIPDTLRGFSAMALSVSSRCDPCIGYHAQALVKFGASRAELAEMLGMAVYMGGGPSLMYAAKASAAFDEFAALAAPATA